MKKSLFLIPAFALLLASCQSEEPTINDPQKPEYAAANGYLSVNLRNSNGTNGRYTRAYESEDENGTNQGTYEDGTGMESTISHVRFYFFNGTGAAFPVRQDVVNEESDNFVDWYPNASEFGGPNHDETVEKTLTATLGLTFTDQAERPAKVVAVANPTTALLAYDQGTATGLSKSSMSLSELQKVVQNFLPANNETPFIMSNSVYVDKNAQNQDEAVYATALLPTNFQSTPTLAAANKVTIYIERVVARVDFGLGTEMVPVTLKDEDGQDVAGNFYKIGEYTLNEGPDGTEVKEAEGIYVKLLGWNVTSTTETSNLIKAVNAQWGVYDILGENNPWYIPSLHRSFWAMNPNNVQTQLGNFGSVTGEGIPSANPSGQYAMALGIPTGTNYTVTYLQENANPYSSDGTAAEPSSPTKVIIAAQLVDQNGKPLTIGQYQSVTYTLEGLQNQLAKQLGSLYYRTTTDDNQTAWAQIAPGMITFSTDDPAGDITGDKEYHVYAVLADDYTEDEDYEWAYSNDGKTFTEFTSEDGESVTSQVNKYMRSKLTSIMVWNSGLTYYFFDVLHLGNDDEEVGYVGIVRNHIYRTTLKSIKGLGTPVYNPGLVITPEKTESAETIIQFTVEPLSWRLVSSSYELDWE